MDELLDIVDANDEVIGQKLRSDIYKLNMTNFRVINAFARDVQGRLWIPRRSLKKTLFPGALDVSVGGHVQSGEDYDSAFERELQEELTISADTITYKVLGFLVPEKHGVSAFQKVYEFTIDYDPDYNKDDFSQCFWIFPQDLHLCLAAGEPAKSDLAVLLRHFY
jgi:isopentenyl-diphosphate delta-isomerase